VRAMNYGLAAGAEAVSTSTRFGVKAHKRRSRCDRKERAAAGRWDGAGGM